MNRQRIIRILKWGVSLAILGVLVAGLDVRELSASFRNADVALMFAALAVGFLSIVVSVYRWQMALEVQGVHAPFGTLMSSTFVSGFLGFLLPAFGEDAVRGYDLYKHGMKGVNVAASILFERICGLLAQVIVGAAALIACHHQIANRAILVWSVAIYTFVILALVIVFNRRCASWVSHLVGDSMRLVGVAKNIEQLSDAILVYRGNGWAWCRIMVTSFAFQFCGFLYFFLISRSLHTVVPFHYFVMLVPIVTILSLAPVSIGGIGVKEGLFVVLFQQLGIAGEHAFLISAVGSSLYIIWVLVGGVIFVLRRGHSPRCDCPA